MITKFIDFRIFLISLTIGLFIVYLTKLKKDMIIKKLVKQKKEIERVIV